MFLSLLATFLLCLLYCTAKRRTNVVKNWPIVGMLPTIITNNNRLLDHMTSVLREFNNTLMFKGPWFCGMDYLLTCSPDNANHMFNHHFSNYPKGKLFNEVFELLGDGIFNVDGDKWVDQRRMAQTHMRTSRFRSSTEECTRDKVSKVLLPLLNKMAESGEVVDLNEVFMRFTFDTTCQLVMGVDPGCLASEFPSIPFAKAVDEIEQALVVRYTVPTFWWKLQRRFRLGTEKKVAEDGEVVESFIAQCIREKRASVKDNNKQACGDLMTPYMDHDDKFLRDTLLNFLVAGKDTIGAALVWLFWLLTNNPDVENKILEELRRRRSSSKVGDNEMIVFNAEEIEGLVYLHAALCEAFRLYPPVAFSQKQAKKGDVLPSGHGVCAGSKVIFSMYSMGRMETIWGKDYLKFKPERWITTKGTLKQEPSYKLIAFHSGPRTCLGKNMTITQMKLVATAMICNFSVRLVEGHVAVPKISIVIKPANGLLVKLKKREFEEY